MLPNGDKSEIHWIKRDSDMLFQKGWENFAKSYSLRYGHFLVFRYESVSQFQVMIYDKSALEIDYWSIRSRDDSERNNNEDSDDDEDEKSDNYIEILDDESEEEMPRTRSPSPQPYKRMRSNATIDDFSKRKKVEKGRFNMDQDVTGEFIFLFYFRFTFY